MPNAERKRAIRAHHDRIDQRIDTLWDEASEIKAKHPGKSSVEVLVGFYLQKIASLQITHEMHERRIAELEKRLTSTD